MNEQEWLSSNDPAAMLEALTHGPAARAGGSDKPPPSHRKLRLFACACCKNLWKNPRI